MVYKFRCEKCACQGEVECSISAYDEIKDCVICEKCGQKMKRVFEPFAGHVEIQGTKYGIDKGSGWMN